jgi:hypothetical protein
MRRFFGKLANRVKPVNKARAARGRVSRALPQVEALETRQLMSSSPLPALSTVLPLPLPILDPIQVKYQSLGGSHGFLGKPTTAELNTPYGGGRYQLYQHGAIYWSWTTGAHDFYGAIESEYFATASEHDGYGHVVQQLLGLPTSDEASVPGVAGGLVTHFQGGAIYYSPSSGVHAVYGLIGAEYAALAGETDAYGRNVQALIGLPTSEEMNVPGVAGARMNTFQYGTIYWSPSTGAHVVYGAIGADYAALAGETDYYGRNVKLLIGLPTSDEINVPGVPGARENTFQYGTIYWSPGTGAHVVYGGIGAKYDSLGGPRSFLGLATSDELAMPGGRVSYFQHGKITWTPWGGAVVVPSVTMLGPYNTGNIVLSNGVPVGGWGQLTIYADGSYNFVGHFHDSGFFSYDDSLVFGIRGASGVLYTFTHTGHVAGTVEFWNSRDDNWDVSGKNPALAAAWVDLVAGGQWRWEAGANLSLGSLLDDLKTALGIAGAVVALV